MADFLRQRCYRLITKGSIKALLAVATLTLLLNACSAGDGESDSSFVVDVPIAYIQRAVPTDNMGNLSFTDQQDPIAFNPGAAVLVQRRATANVEAKNITASSHPAAAAYSVRDLSGSDDGTKLLFSMRAAEIPNADDIDQPRWNIYEYDLQREVLRRVIDADLIADAAHDISPAFLPDGRIVFSSTRQRGINAIRLDENKPQFPALDENRNAQATLLHVMNDDGTDIQQITYNTSHDLYPSVLDDGRIAFTRMANDQADIYTVNPDGTEVRLLYGSKSHDTGTGTTAVQFLRPRELASGELLVQVTPFDLDHFGSNWFLINTQDYINVDQPITNNVADTSTTQTAMFEQLIPSENEIALSGRYLSVHELNDGSQRFLVSWDSCRLNDLSAINSPDVICSENNLANSRYNEGPSNAALWIYDGKDSSQKPLVIPPVGQMISEAIAIEDTTPASYIPPVQGIENWGTLKIRSVYDLDGLDTSAVGLAAIRDPLQTDFNSHRPKFIRISKAVGIPDDDTYDFQVGSAIGRANEMQQILGYVPIEPDGSVTVRVPADVSFKISLLDQQGRRIHRNKHSTWLQLRPGETMECNGCHDSDSINPHGRPDVEAASINAGSQTTGPFANTLPVLSANYGETMAETFERINGLRTLTPDLIYLDDWTDPAVIAPALAINLLYSDLNAIDDPDFFTRIPSNESCLQSWEIRCRITINYEQHIQPIWDKERSSIDPVDNVTVLTHTCTACHNSDNPVLPAGQLDLGDKLSDRQNSQFTSYQELLFPDFEETLDPITNTIINLDTDPVAPDLQGIIITPPMNRNGALLSAARFFNRFEDGLNPTHFGHLTPIELKLISEWLDIGGQYYNNPFDAPEN